MAMQTIDNAILAAPATVAVDLIDPDPDQPRKHFDAQDHQRLVESIRDEGLMQPIGLRRVADRFVIVYGERRFRAVQTLGWDTIPAVELSRDNRLDVLVLQLVENLTRADLHPIEEAHAFRRLIDAGMPATEVARRIGKSKGYVSHKLSLLTLPDPLGIYLEAGLLTEGQVRQLARLKGFYGDMEHNFMPAEAGLARLSEDEWRAWPDEVVIPAAVIAWRPLDWPPGHHLPDFHGEVAETIARSARALLEMIVAEPVQRTWVPVTWWYATMLASFTGSPAGTVAAAKSFVDRHIDLVASAQVAVFVYGNKPDTWPEHHRRDGWQYLADLRHAGFASDAESVKAWIGSHLDLVEPLIAEDGTGFAAPSAQQASSPEAAGFGR